MADLSSSSEEGQSPLSLGQMHILFAPSPYVVAAPHGTYDGATGEIVKSLARILEGRWAGVVANRYRHPSHPINVNRPTEGIRPRGGAGSESFEERRTPRAKLVHDYYLSCLSLAAGHISSDQGPLSHCCKCLVEIHGNVRPESANLVEVALFGIEAQDAGFVKASLQQLVVDRCGTLATDSHVAGSTSGPLPAPQQPPAGMKVVVEGPDRVHFTAVAAKKYTFHRISQRAIHIEMPAALRDRVVRDDLVTGLARFLDLVSSRFR